MAALLVLNCTHLLLAILVAKDSGSSSYQIYPFTAPHLTLLAAVVVLLVGIRLRYPPAPWLLAITTILLVGTLFTAEHGSDGWSGNDAGGMSWTLIIGGLSIVNAISAFVLVIYLVPESLSKTREHHD